VKTWIAAAAVFCGLTANVTVLADDGGAKFFSSCKGLLNFWDGKPLEANYDAGAMGYCVGVVHGVRGSLQVLGGELKDGHLRVCLPEDYIEQAGVRAVVKYLGEHPEKLTHEDVTITMLALRSAYPCK
jgi:hypothetical protein